VQPAAPVGDQVWTPSGSTVLAAVIGSPVRHSRSPAIHNAAFRALGLDWSYVAFDVPEGGAAGAIAAMRALDIRGLSVTMPHKAAVAALVDELTDDAARLDAVNCVRWRDDHLVGDNTDGPGFLASLHDAGVSVDGRACAVLGAGGAARAVVLALARAGAASVAVLNRTDARAVEAARLAEGVGRVGTEADLAAADLVVNATSVGMGGDERLPLDIELVRPGTVVADLVYEPLTTPLLAAAAVRGATVVDGLGMLVHQAAVASESWTGVAPPVDVMRAAALA
jgi:shikimate dehydrogenase